ncbi:MAG TPA: glycosyltransferase family 4 protein [Kineosporiaceae bacterium]|nr:glycosyltransferase family 4 protein [Kineosporiaceae bacterium]
MSPSRRRRRASPAWEGRKRIIVATFPGRGLYARHLGHPEGVDGVHRPTVRAQHAGPVFGRSWLVRHLDEVDVVHVHGLPSRLSAEEVASAADEIRESGKPLVVTGYHLSDPTGRADQDFRAQLDALIPRADAVVTLTESAAEEMRHRWQVEPIVLPHPHAVDFVRMRQERQRYRSGEFVVGAHLAGLNLPTDPLRLVMALTAAIGRLQSAGRRIRLSVHLHETVLDPGAAGYSPLLVRRIEELVRARGGLVRVHRPFTESQLWDHLFSLDLSVVPGLHGSHSVWPEACADLGTQALLPALTHAATQRPCLVYDDSGEAGAVAESLHTALTTAIEQGCLWRADPEERWAERVKVAESLRSLYERLIGEDA